MPSEVALGPIYTALKALLAASPSVTGVLSTKAAGAGGGAAIYDEGGVTQGASMPYLTIGAGTQIGEHTFGSPSDLRYGWNCTLQVKVVGTGMDAVGMGILSAIIGVLYQGRALSVAGYRSAYVDEVSIVPTIVTTQAGVTIREWPAIVRVRVHD